MMTAGTFKYDTKTEIYVFRDDVGNSCSWNKQLGVWEVWAVGATLKDTFSSLPPALKRLSRMAQEVA